MSCGMPVPPVNGSIVGQDFSLGASATYQCNPGFRLSGPVTTSVICQESGRWSPIEAPPRCVPGHCGTPEPIVNGQIIGENYNYRGSVVYQCNPGFRLIGVSVRICEQDHRWSGRTPVCVRKFVNCTEPGHVENSIRQVLPSGPHRYSFQTTVSYRCNPGYYLLGTSSISCQGDGTWDRSLPKCLYVTEKCTNTQTVTEAHKPILTQTHKLCDNKVAL
uniref:Sushi domain-containing protein n=1 Tax=Acanthochromis polyacanthus TaxID=80966 RepID=A0A3Q1FM44_9TELE